MKTNNTLVDVYDSTVHSKSKLIHEYDFVKGRTIETDKFLVKCATAGYTAMTFAARLCVLQDISIGGFTNEKIQQH